VSGQLAAPGRFSSISDPASDAAVFLNPDFKNYSEIRAQWHNDWKINSHSNLQFGLEARHIDAPKALMGNNFDMAAYAIGDLPVQYYGEMLFTTPVQAKSKREIVGIYGQYQHQVFEKTNLTLGLRYDDFSGIGHHLSPRVGVVQEAGRNHSFKLLFGEAFRAPAENELNLLNNPVVFGNQNLKPETVQTWELVWVGQWKHSYVSFGYFENHFKDSIARNPTGIGNGMSYDNIAQEPTKGFELELSHEFSERWLTRATYTYFSENSNLSFREADRLASLNINYRRRLWNANLSAIYSGEREMLSRHTDSGIISLDDYVTPGSSTALREGIQNRGLEMLFGIDYQF